MLYEAKKIFNYKVLEEICFANLEREVSRKSRKKHDRWCPYCGYGVDLGQLVCLGCENDLDWNNSHQGCRFCASISNRYLGNTNQTLLKRTEK